MKEKLKHGLDKVTLKQLRVLRAVSRTGTISGAARALNVTPPAVSLQMKLFGEIVALPLVERTNEGLRPTGAGELILDTANRIEAALSECAEAIEDLKGVDRGSVSAGVISTAKYFAPRALAVFARRHPKIELKLLVGNRQETVAALRSFEVDLTIMGRPPTDFEVESSAIGDHPHIIIAAPDHPLASKKRVTAKQLGAATFLLREEGSGTRALMQRLFAKQGLNPTLGMQIGSNETIKQAVMAGLGIALLSAHTVAAELNDGRLVVLKVTGMPVVRKWYVVKRRDKRLLPASKALWDFLTTSGAQFLPKV